MKQDVRAFFSHLCGKEKGADALSMRRRKFFLSIAGLCALAAAAGAQEEEIRKSMIVRSRCVGCGDCVRQCPVKAISLNNGKASVDQAVCVGCRTCQMTCSFGAPRL